MGTCGNRPGFKIFSFNTTVRSATRNERFMLHFEPYDGKEFDPNFNEYFKSIIADGTYTFNKMDPSVRMKIKTGIDLSDAEIKKLIADNPQKCGDKGRVMTQLRSMKDQGFLKFWPKPSTHKFISLTKLGKELLSNEINSTDVYCRAMIGLHANNPSREKMWNKSRPFLNTLFVIEEVNKQWKEMGHDNLGIAAYEFSTFVLTMIDCNYKNAADEIIKYRKRNHEKLICDINYLMDYAALKMHAINVNKENIKTEYPDDVFRKFKMTGLLEERGRADYKFYSFSEFNIDKVKAILLAFKDYSFISFENQDKYYEFLESIKLPWEESLETRINIAKAKAKKIGVEDQIEDYSNIAEVEKYLDYEFYSNVLSDAIDKAEMDSLRNELLILSGSLEKKSIFDEIDEPLRLEYVLALILGKRFGKPGLVSNIIYDSTGWPLHAAPGGKTDILYKHLKFSFIMEPTMIRSPSEMMVRETTGVREHYLDEKSLNSNLKYGMLISPATNSRVTSYFKFVSSTEEVNVIPFSIDAFVDAMDNTNNIDDFNIILNSYLESLQNKKPEQYVEDINSIKMTASL